MAVLKFRAWHEVAKQFFECVGFAGFNGAESVVYVVAKNTTHKRGGGRLILGAPSKHYKVQQSTGLFDSFGTEIYEGDLVLTYEDSEAPYEVVWDKKAACWGFTNIKAIYTLIAGHSERFKVIGNIFENPEFKRNENTQAT